MENQSKSNLRRTTKWVKPKYRSDFRLGASSEKTITYNSKTNKKKPSSMLLDNIPHKKIRISGLKPSEKRRIAEEIKFELEQVRILQRKLPVSASSPSMQGSVINLSRTMENNGFSGIDSPVQESKFKGSAQNSVKSLKGSAQKSEKLCWSKPEFGLSDHRSNAGEIFKECKGLLAKIMKKKDAYVFGKPVDVIRHMCPDYHDIIKKPMDLGTVRRKLASGTYNNPRMFAQDVNLTFDNAIKYNPEYNYYNKLAKDFKKFFEGHWAQIERRLVEAEENEAKFAMGLRKQSAQQSLKEESDIGDDYEQYSEKRKTSPFQTVTRESKLPKLSNHNETSISTGTMPKQGIRKQEKQRPNEEDTRSNDPRAAFVTPEETERFDNDIESLSPKRTKDFLAMAKRANCISKSDGGYSIELGRLDQNMFLQLRSYLSQLLDEMQKEKLQNQGSKKELKNVSVSGSREHAQQELANATEEYVDIGENEPLPQFPRVEIPPDHISSSDSDSDSDSDSNSSSSGSDSAVSSRAGSDEGDPDNEVTSKPAATDEL